MQAEALQVRARCGEMVEKIKALYGMDLSQVRISFDLRGRSAGKAGGAGYSLPGSAYTVKFNRDMLTRAAFEHVIQETVPHEYAHVVCFMNTSLGRNHDYGWARVCRALGGSGERCHEEEVVYGKGLTYEYITNKGQKVRLSEKRHRYVQQGGTLTYKQGRGVVTRICAYSIVGARGKTLAAPIVRQPDNHPAQIEATVAQQRIATMGTQQELLLTALFAPPVTKEVPVQTLVLRGLGTAPAPATQHTTGESKAAVSRRIMLSGHRSGQGYEQIIQAMMFANGYDRQLARATYKANADKVGVPQE